MQAMMAEADLEDSVQILNESNIETTNESA